MEPLPAFETDPRTSGLWFVTDDQAGLTETLVEALGAKVGAHEQVMFVERVDLVVDGVTLPLFHDEDGSSHLDLSDLDDERRAGIAAQLGALAGAAA